MKEAKFFNETPLKGLMCLPKVTSCYMVLQCNFVGKRVYINIHGIV